jgi:hypothetical protein
MTAIPPPRQTRGFLNNNPGNMNRSAGEPWQGEIRDSNDKRLSGFQVHELLAGRFCVFASAEWGIRALVRNLQAYQAAGWDTISMMIDHWAPPNENDTTAYKQAVSQKTGIGLYDRLDMKVYANAHAVVDAIIRVECNGMPYEGKELEDGLRLAGVVRPAGSSSTAKGAAIASAATVAQPLLGTLQQPIQDTVDALSPLSDTAPWIQQALAYGHLALTVIAVAGVLWMLKERFSRADRDKKIDPNPTEVGV